MEKLRCGDTDESRLIGKDVAIYYDDKFKYNHISKKDGNCLADNDRVITIRNTSGYIEKIPYYRIIRVLVIREWVFCQQMNTKMLLIN